MKHGHITVDHGESIHVRMVMMFTFRFLIYFRFLEAGCQHNTTAARLDTKATCVSNQWCLVAIIVTQSRNTLRKINAGVFYQFLHKQSAMWTKIFV